MRKLDLEKESEIGRREHLFDLKRQIFIDAELAVKRLQKISNLPGGTQLVGLDTIIRAESRLAESREHLMTAADQLREAWSWRGGEQPDTTLQPTVPEPVIVEDSPLLRQLELESAVEKSSQNLIPYAEKLASTTLCALEQLSKTTVPPEVPEHTTLPEKITSIEVRINRLKAEIAQFEEQFRPLRLAQASSRFGRTSRRSQISGTSVG